MKPDKKEPLGEIQIQDMAELDWTNIGKPGLFHKGLRIDYQTGEFLGLFRFDANARSGIHRHVDIAISYILCGTVTDYVDTFRQGDIGVNPPGDTHDALSYEGALLVSRLEGSTIYPESEEELKAIHPGAYRESFGTIEETRNPDVAPIPLREQPLVNTGCHGVEYRLLYDYGSTNHDYRMTSVQFRAGAQLPSFVTTARLDIFVIAGDLNTDAGPAMANHFVTLKANSTATLTSNFGCHLLVWSEAPVQWLDPDFANKDPFGF
jgi:ChrR-like protein with cupin domain